MSSWNTSNDKRENISKRLICSGMIHECKHVIILLLKSLFIHIVAFFVVVLETILAFRKNSYKTKNCTFTHGKNRKPVFLRNARSHTLHERSNTVHKLFNTIDLSTVTFLPLYKILKNILCYNKLCCKHRKLYSKPCS